MKESEQTLVTLDLLPRITEEVDKRFFVGIARFLNHLRRRTDPRSY